MARSGSVDTGTTTHGGTTTRGGTTTHRGTTRQEGTNQHEWIIRHEGVGAAGRIAALLSRLVVKPVIWMWSKTPHLPWPYRALDLAASVLPAVGGVVRSPVPLPDCRAEWMAPADVTTEPRAAILYLHGGAFLVGGIRSHRRLVSRIVKESGIASLAVDYRQLPDSPVSDSIADARAGLNYLLRIGIPAEKIALVGDSAGGYLALRLALDAAQQGINVGAVAAISPIIDLDPTTKIDAAQGKDALFPISALSTLWREVQAAETNENERESLGSVVSASDDALAALAPLYLQVGAGEVLLPDSERLTAKIADLGGSVTLEIFPGQIHVFQAGADVIGEGRAALSSIAGHIATSLAVATHTRRAA